MRGVWCVGGVRVMSRTEANVLSNLSIILFCSARRTTQLFPTNTPIIPVLF